MSDNVILIATKDGIQMLKLFLMKSTNVLIVEDMYVKHDIKEIQSILTDIILIFFGTNTRMIKLLVTCRIWWCDCEQIHL